MNLSKLFLNPGKEQSLLRFHPWVFSGAIQRAEGDLEEGDMVEVYSDKGDYLATGHCETGSIAVRVLSFNKITPDQDFWTEKIRSAWKLRQQLGLTNSSPTNIYRLVFGEGDGLPGLIVDYYNGTAVIQAHSVGMHLAKKEITAALRDVLGDALIAIYDKSAETLPKNSGVTATNGYLYQSEKNVTTPTLENNHLFSIDWETGQKTGFFIDQRENRKLLASYSKGKTVLNTFCYSGGFSIYALKAGAQTVHSVDSSKKAIDLTEKNVALNFPYGNVNHSSFAIDTFEFLKGKENQYDIIILDPPAFAKNQHARHNAVQGYKRINTEAIQSLKSGGLLFTFSCSGVVDRQLFNSTVMASAIVAGRKARILHQLSQPPDHPVNIFHPEGEYLKGLVIEVE